MSVLKKGRLGRALSLSRLGARMAIGQGRRMLSSDPRNVHTQLAATLVRELGQLKGLPMKIGQLLSYMEGVVPDEYRGIYQDMLAQLRTQSEPMGWDVAAAVFEQDLGAPPERLLDSIDTTPIASASIGQVYRAVHDGQPVCVKIQYPDIGEATVSDLQNLDGLLAVMHAIMPTVDTHQMIEDFRQRLAEECDYRQEAAYQRRFAEIYDGDADILVPPVVDGLCARRVLTSRYVHGIDLQTFVADATEAQRTRAGEALFVFAFGTLLRHGLFHADPHPGNLLFGCGPDERLCVLDYGCVQPIDATARRDLAAMLRAAVAGDDLQAPALTALGFTDLDERSAAAMMPIVQRTFEPVTAPQPYRFSRQYALEVSRATVAAKLELSTHYLSRRGHFSMQRQGVMFVVRNLFGLASVWGTLGAQGHYRRLLEPMIAAAEQAAEPPSAPGVEADP